MFLKKDLINGMVVQFNNGHRRLVWDNKLIDSNGYVPMSHISDELIDLNNIHSQYIAKIFLTHDVCYFSGFFHDENLTCIWERIA